MNILIFGSCIFFAVHLFPRLAPAMRASAIAKLGDNGYKAGFSVVSLLGLGLIIYGKSLLPGYEQTIYWHEMPGMRHATYLLVAIAMLLAAASQIPCNLRRKVRHPLLLATLFWSAGHLLVNGDLASIILFGSFLAFAVLDALYAFADPVEDKPALPIWRDGLAIVVGLLLTFVLMRYHGTLFGMPLM